MCVRFNGKSYCWDKAAKRIVEIKITDVPLNSCPKEVLAALLDKSTESKEGE
jgi:hypothetical protein